MKKFKVIALSVGGLGNKIFKAGDEVNENSFLPGMAEKLVAKDFLKPLNEVKEVVKVEEEKNDSVIEDLREDFEILSGKKPSMKWNEKRLNEEIEKLS